MSERCQYCGNNPISHTNAKAVSIATDLFAPVQKTTFPLFRRAGSLTERFAQGLIAFVYALGAASYSDKLPSRASGATKVLWEEAKRRDIDIRNVRLLNESTDAYIATIHGHRIFFVGIPRPQTTKSGSDWWLDNKAELKKRLSAAGIPVPQGKTFTAYDPMRRYFAQMQKPAIVKPVNGSRGRHTTTHIYTEEQLRHAFDVAKQISRTVILEEHLFGSVYRATAIGGKIVGILEGMPPRVVGDGVHTIEQLVEIKNDTRHEKVSAVVLGEKHQIFLARTGKAFDSIPAKDEQVDLIEKIGVSYGGSSRELMPETHPETLNILEKAVHVVDDPIIGFDFIIPDITKSPTEQRWGIIECNSKPFINLHHDPVEGVPINAAAKLWDYIESHIKEF